MKLVRHGDGYSCLPCGRKLEPVPGRGNRGKRRCPGCGFSIRLPDRRRSRDGFPSRKGGAKSRNWSD
jgi:DNA-directed RNA polymerase subunit RPC12/RpoP